MRLSAIPLKYCVRLNPDTLSDETPPGFEFDYIDIGGVDRSAGVVQTERMPFAEAPSRARRVVKRGDVIVSTVRTYLRAVAPIDHRLDGQVCSTGFAVLRPSRIDSRFLAYAVQDKRFVDTVVARSFGISYPAINASDLVRIPIPIAPVQQQRAIVAFLDRECTRIKSALAACRRSVAALAEQRDEVFDRLARHYPTVALRYRLERIEQGWSPECAAYLAGPGEWGVLKVGCVNYGRFRSEEHKRLPDELEPRPTAEVHIGDVLMSRANTRELVGSAAIVDQTGGWRLMLSDKTYRLVPNASIRRRFLALAIMSRVCRDQIEIAASGASSSMQNISQATVLALRVPRIDLDMQMAIEREATHRFEAIDRATARLASIHGRLSEYRDALITEAVTGQLDVADVSERQLDERLSTVMEEMRQQGPSRTSTETTAP